MNYRRDESCICMRQKQCQRLADGFQGFIQLKVHAYIAVFSQRGEVNDNVIAYAAILMKTIYLGYII